MTTAFDPDAGVLRLSHAALAVLARLAVAPTDPSLRDHATAPPLAELRAAGILGPAGIHPDVLPLAEVLGEPTAALTLQWEVGDEPRHARGWATPRLLVIGVAAPDGSYELMADAPAEAGNMIGELVGLAPGLPTTTASRPAEPDRLEEALGAPVRARWRLWVLPWAADAPAMAAPGAVPALEVADADASGVWRVEPAGDDHVALCPTDAGQIRRRIDALVAAAMA